MNRRMAQWPHQEAKGTKRTRSSAVHVRLCNRQCSEHWLLFARTPKKKRERERVNADENKEAKQKA